METKKATAAQQATATTATETKNSSNSRTVKNQSQNTAATAADPKEEEKKNRRSAAAKKAAETRRAKKEQEARELAEEAARLKAEEAARLKAEEKTRKENNKAQRATNGEQLKDHRQQYTAARKEVKDGQTPIYYMHYLNKLATGKIEGRTAAPALAWCYEDINDTTPTTNNYKGFSYDVVKTDSRGRICKMLPAPADLEIIYYQFGIVRVNTRAASDIDMIDTYQGYFVLVPVKINEDGILQAAQSYTAFHKAVRLDCENIYRTKTTRQAIKEATARRHANNMKLQAEKIEREAMKAKAAAALEVARQEAETANTVEIPRTTVRRSWWRNIAASLF